jgi:hypothetical protein
VASRVAALVFGIGVAIAIGEAAVRMLVPAREFWAVPDVYRAVDTPDVRYTYQPGLRGEAFGVDLRTNALGFRGPDWTSAKPDSGVRVALVGDSHAFGLGVPFAATAGEVLAGMLRRCGIARAEVLNFGVNGYNSRQELGVLRGYVLGFHPDVLVVLPTSNDHEPASYADAAGFLTSLPPRWSSASTLQSSLLQVFGPSLRRSRLWIWVRRRLLGWPTVPAWTGPSPTEKPPADPHWLAPIDDLPPPAALDGAVGRPLRAMIDEAKARAIPVAVASLAAPMDYRRLLRRVTREESVPWLELLALFPEADSWPDVLRRFGLGWDPHLNAVAHERFGRALFAMLRDGGYLRPDPSADADCTRATIPPPAPIP